MPPKISSEAEQQRDDIAESGEQWRRLRRAGGRTASITPAVRHGSDFTTLPRASITALMPVGVARRTGSPSSAARSRAWARCCGGPQLPNQASFDGIEDEVGPVALVDDLAGEDDLVAELEADLAPLAAEVDRARPGPGREIEIARREARQADRRKQRPHRQIFAVGHEVRLVVAADDPAARTERVDAVGGAIDVHAVARGDRDAAGQQPIARAEQRRPRACARTGRTPDARRCARPRPDR